MKKLVDMMYLVAENAQDQNLPSVFVSANDAAKHLKDLMDNGMTLENMPEDEVENLAANIWNIIDEAYTAGFEQGHLRASMLVTGRLPRKGAK